jgi:MFS family permease
MNGDGPLAVPSFRRLVAAWTFSNFGDSALYLTLAIWVKDLTGSNASAGIVFLFLGLPAFLAPVAGHVADRFSRRRLVVVANLAAAGAIGTLAFVDGPSDVWIIYAVTFGYGLLTYLTSACASGLIKDLVPDPDLASANGILTTIDQGLRLVSPLAGAGLYAAFGGTALAALTATTLVIAAAIVATIDMVESEPTAAAERAAFLVEFTAGFRHLRSTRGLAQLTVILAVATAITGLANTAIFAVVDEGLGRPASFFAVIASIQGLGSVLGGLTASRLVARFGERTTLAIGLLVLGGGITSMLTVSTIVVMSGALVVGVGIPWAYISYTTLRQRATPATLQGRVSAAANLAFNAPQTLGTALGAALITVIGYRTIAVVMIVVVVTCGVLALRSPDIDGCDERPGATKRPADQPAVAGRHTHRDPDTDVSAR